MATHSLDQLTQRVIELAAAQVGADAGSVSLNTDFYTDLNYDSLDTVELMITLEEEFELDIADPVAEPVRTVGAAVAMLRSLGVGNESAQGVPR